MARQQQISLFGGFTPTGVDTSATSRLNALAGLSSQVGELAFQQGAKIRRKEGALAGTEAGIEAAEKGEGLDVEEAGLFSIFDNSFNDSMRSAYIAGIDNDNKEKFSQLASDNATDLEAFSRLAGDYKKGVLQNVDKETSLLLQQSMNTDIANISIRIRESEKQKNLTEADNTQQIAIQNNIDAALGHAFDGDFQQAADSLIIAQKFNDSRLASGKISPVEHKKTNEALLNSVDIEANRSQFDKMLDNNNVDKMIGFLQKVSDNTIPGKTPEEHRDLLSILQTDMDKHYRLNDRVEAELSARESEKQEVNNEKLFLSIIEGRATSSMVGLAMRTDSISTAQGKALINQINTRGVGVDDHSVIIEINELMRNEPQAAKQRIMENMGTNLTGGTAERLMNGANNVLDTGPAKSPLNTNDAKRFKRFLTKSAFDPGIGGFGTIENNKKIAKLELVFDERVLTGEDPAIVARDLIDFNEFLDIPPARFGSNSDPKESLEQLTEYFIDQQKIDEGDRLMSNDDFDREATNLQRAIDLLQINEEFNQAMKEALDGEQ